MIRMSLELELGLTQRGCIGTDTLYFIRYVYRCKKRSTTAVQRERHYTNAIIKLILFVVYIIS